MKCQQTLINDLLDVSSIVLGKITLNLQEINLLEIIQSSIRAFEIEANKKQVTLQFSSHSKEISLNLDPGRMTQILNNLILNALKFTPEHGKISIHVEEQDAQILIQVKDTGMGIEPEFLPYIFDRFSQSNKVKSRCEAGLGLGLSLVRDFVQLHGGHIEASSAGENQGSVFSLYFPKI